MKRWTVEQEAIRVAYVTQGFAPKLHPCWSDRPTANLRETLTYLRSEWPDDPDSQLVAADLDAEIAYREATT